MARGERTLRVLGGALCGSGALLLAAPAVTARAVSGPHAVPPVWLVRVLGTRYLAQGLVLLLRPGQRMGQLSAAIDASHGVSMLAVAAARSQYRRAALTSAVAAAGSATLAAAAARRHG